MGISFENGQGTYLLESRVRFLDEGLVTEPLGGIEILDDVSPLRPHPPRMITVARVSTWGEGENCTPLCPPA